MKKGNDLGIINKMSYEERDRPGNAQDERRGLQDGVCAGEQGEGVVGIFGEVELRICFLIGCQNLSLFLAIMFTSCNLSIFYIEK